jgi:tetratricopeptide (TPR) repeat protein
MTRQCVLVLLCAAWLYAADTPQALMDGGHHKRLRAIAEQQYRDHPNDPEALWMMSFVKLSWDDHKTALELAEKAVAADPQNPRYHLALAQAVGREGQTAGILRQPGLALRFKRELAATLALDPKNVAAMQYQIMFDFEAPGIMGGDKARGRATAEQIARIDPVRGYLEQATLARYDKQDGRIEELLRKAVEAGPASYQAHVSLADFCLGSVKKYGEAEALAREALRMDPSRINAHTILVVSLIRQERWAEIDAALAQAEKDDPDNLFPYFRAGYSCLERPNELARGERYFRKYLTQEPEPYAPNHWQTHWRLGQVLEKQGRKPEAIAEFQAAVKLNPDSPAKQDLKRLK